jgi:hypothetical protein
VLLKRTWIWRQRPWLPWLEWPVLLLCCRIISYHMHFGLFTPPHYYLCYSLLF